MRLAILSDVHGNAYALEAVLAGIRAASPDAVYNLGDTVWGGADPARAYALQLEHAPPTVRGNTDETVAGWHGGRSEAWREWVVAQLPPEVPGVLGRLPTTAAAAGGELLMAHGGMNSAWDALFAGTGGGAATPDGLLEQVAGWPEARVVVVGHTHREQFACACGVTFVNVGPVSRQVQGDPAARWAMLERRGPVWNVTFQRTEYDVEAAARWALAHCIGGEKEARQLRSGRA
ncbi:metallophosphoesterase family protein [Deinococcus frigens]|uniref:metallophosphoesterase family protein n=1 Tax=Deinococcus frigens TaxID=249403 RepID=UPI00049574CB|nr:metallophosphoesterase family protein [Deinococcus frigens]